MTIGIDIGAHKIAAVSWDGEIKSEKMEEYPENVKSDYGKWIGWVKGWLSDFSGAESLGICVAGIVKEDTVIKSPNLPILNGAKIGQDIEDFIGMKVHTENDANAFLWAEFKLGAARGSKNAVGITLGTGIGGSFLIDGKIYKGSNDSAGEIGHMILSDKRTFEELAGSKAFGDGDVKKLTGSAREGDENARQQFEKVGMWIGRGLANIVNTIDPEIIVVGGGISNAWDLLEDSTRSEMNKLIVSPPSKKVNLLKTELGNFAPAVGAALIAQRL